MLFSPETNCKIVRISALVRSFEHIRNWFLYKMFFPSGCAVFKVQFRPSRFARWLPARIFQILCASRFACAHPSFSSRFLRSLKTIQVQEEEQSFDQALLGFLFIQHFRAPQTHLSVFVSTWNEPPSFLFDSLPRKEVIQPHLPIRLPCYDFTPVIGLTFDGWLLSVTSPASGAPNSHGVTGGVYKARERIHRGMLIRDY